MRLNGPDYPSWGREYRECERRVRRRLVAVRILLAVVGLALLVAALWFGLRLLPPATGG